VSLSSITFPSVRKWRQQDSLDGKLTAGLVRGSTHLELGIGPSRNLNNHVENGLLLVGIEGDIVEGGDGEAILLDVDAVLQSVLGGNLADRVLGSHCGRCTGAV
jgi:hypothetical protein